jgi:hypothetical protein
MSDLKLSEAIRLGAMLKPKAIGGVGNDASCALRAASDAVGIDAVEIECGPCVNYSVLEHRFPVLRAWVMPPYGGEPAKVEGIIYTLNDCRDWTREQIADWVETIEPQADPAQAHGAARSSDAVDPTVRHTEVSATRA